MEQSGPFISRVRLKNYKSIAECDVRLGPLTVLIGPNGSGKSNFLDAMAFLARALETTPQTAINERGGLAEIVRRVPEPADSFSIEVEATVPWGFRHDSKKVGKYGFEIGPSRRRGLRPFEVVWEQCEPPEGSKAAAWRADYGSVRGGPLASPLAGVEPDRLYLPVAGAQVGVAGPTAVSQQTRIPSPFTPLFQGLSAMRFYSFALAELRRPEPKATGSALGHRGEHLGDVLGMLEEEHPLHKARVDAYLQAAVPGVEGIDRWYAGTYVTVMLRALTGVAGRDVVFGPDAMSDGTLRAAAVLAALFQPAALDGHIPLIGVEEPEIALHPAAAGVLFDALSEASGHVQVLATTQSPDLLDREELDIATIRAVSMEQGLTAIGGVDRASREIVRDKLYTLGELMRGNQITPSTAGGGHTGQAEG